MSAAKRRAGRRGQPGFTLLELIVVIAIFAVFSLMAYGGLDSVLTTRARVEEALARTAAMQKAWLKLRNDLQQVRNRPARDGYGDAQPAVKLDDRSREPRLEFTRGGWRNPLLQPRPGLERVAWHLDDDGNLVRDSWRVLDQAQDSAVVSLVVLENVDDVEWRLLDDTQEWRTGWPPQDLSGQAVGGSSVPVAIELTLTTREWGTLKFLFKPGVEAANIPLLAGSSGDGGDGGPQPGSDEFCAEQPEHESCD